MITEISGLFQKSLGGGSGKILRDYRGSGASGLMVAFQFSGGENPSEVFREKCLEMTVEGNGKVVVFLGDIEGEDTF